jgi:hypothetical protein
MSMDQTMGEKAYFEDNTPLLSIVGEDEEGLERRSKKTSNARKAFLIGGSLLLIFGLGVVVVNSGCECFTLLA